jgi:hypothetical protein
MGQTSGQGGAVARMLDIEDLIDLSIIGGGHMARGFVEFDRWKSEMSSEYPYLSRHELREIFKAAAEYLISTTLESVAVERLTTISAGGERRETLSEGVRHRAWERLLARQQNWLRRYFIARSRA